MKLLAKWSKRYGEKLETTHQAGQSLLDMVLSSYEQERADLSTGQGKSENSAGFDPRTGLLPLAAVVVGGVAGGRLVGAAESPMLARCLEEDDSVVG